MTAMTSTTPPINPYVGPRTFSYEQRDLFFGREREARDLLARVLSERLLLFYAQSGAGKSSLLHTRLIPQLREEKGFAVLPVGRVGGELPAGLTSVDNIYAFNLMTSIDQGNDPAPFAHLSLSDFLAHLVLREGERWLYDTAAVPVPPSESQANQRYAIIVDQFEEIITAHSERWQEREGFFRQLNQAMLDDPNLWVVLTLREDFVAALDPYAPLMADRLRARFYMERMGVAGALEAVRRPAELEALGDRRRPFAPGVAEKLVDNLRQMRVPGQQSTVPGPNVEPVQLQVVCYQLWENLGKGTGGNEITLDDLAQAGDVDRALTQYYEDTVKAVLDDPSATGVSERQLRTWFDDQVITEAGTRGLVHQSAQESGGLPNAVVGELQKRFMVRAETRSGDTWIELVHDRFVEPIRESNAVWFPSHLSTLQRQAALWEQQKRPDGLLLSGDALAEAERWVKAQIEPLEPYEQNFLAVCQRARERIERERRQARRIRLLAITAFTVSVLAVIAAALAWGLRREAVHQERRARAGELATNAVAALNAGDDPSLVLMLSREAVRTSLNAGEQPILQAQDALQRTVGEASPWMRTLPKHYHHGAALSVAYSPNGKTVASAGGDETIRLWDVASGQQVGLLSGHENAVWSVQFSPDGKRLVSASWDKTARVWDVGTGEELARFVHPALLWWASISPDGTKALTAGEDRIARLWDVTTGKEIRSLNGHEGRVMMATFSPDGRTALTVSADGTGRLWDVSTGKERQVLRGHTSVVFSGVFSGDGRRVITASADGTSRVWDSENGQEILNLRGESSWMKFAAFSHDDTKIVTTGDEGDVGLWDAHTGDRLRRIATGPGLVNSAAFSSDDAKLVTASDEGALRLWQADTGQEIPFISGHTGTVNHVRFSPDGRRLLSAGDDNVALLWDTDTGQLLRRLAGHTGGITSIAFSPDGGLVLTASTDGTARLWSAATGAVIHVLDGHDGKELVSAQFSPDGRRIVSAGRDGTAQVWDVPSGEKGVRLTRDERGLQAAGFSPDGERILTAGDNAMESMWDAETGALLFDLKGGHTGAIRAAIFSPDGRTIATGGDDPAACLWSALDGTKLICLKGHDKGINRLAFSPDSAILATAGDDLHVRLWDAATGDLRHILAHGDSVTAITFSGDGKTLITASKDAKARLWDVRSGREQAVLLGHQGPVTAVDINPNNTLIATGGNDRTVRLWAFQSPLQLRGHADSVRAVDFSLDGRWAVTASADGTARVWDLLARTTVTSFTQHIGPVNAAVFSPDGSSILTGGDDGKAYLRRASDGRALQPPLEGGTLPVRAVAFSPDGQVVATAGDDGIPVLWNVSTGDALALLEGPGAGITITSIKFSPDGKTIATASADQTVRLWDAATGRPSGAPLTGFPGPVNAVAFSPDGKTLAVAGKDAVGKQHVRLWDIGARREIKAIGGHTEEVVSLAFAPDGKTLATASLDGTARVWNIATGQEERRLSAGAVPAKMRAIAISPDGKLLLTGGDDGVARLWPSLNELIARADALIQRQPSSFWASERQQYGLEPSGN